MELNSSAYTRGASRWGAEVKKRLLDREVEQKPPWTQKGVIEHLVSIGIEIDKGALSNLLNGIGVTKRQDAIKAINELLGIVVL